MKDNKFIDKLSEPKVVKISTVAAFILVFSMLIIGYIIAQFGPRGYNMIDNFISDMGSIVYTPFPYTRTISNVIGGPLFMPITFYMKKQLASNEIPNISPKRLRLGKVGFIGMLILFLGMVCSGIITEDVHYLTHSIIAIIVIFGGFLATMSYGLLIAKYSTEIPKNVGILMVLAFPIIAILAIIGFPSIIFYEWVLLLTLYAWVMTCSIYLLK